MKKAIRISVVEPCSEKFETFATTSKGSFCSTCEKEVIDFTNMPEKELINYLSKKPRNTCGQFKKSQLRTYAFHEQTKATNYLLRGMGIMSFSLLALCVSPLQAQEVASLNTGTIQTVQNTIENDDNSVAVLQKKYTVKGTVLDETDQPLAFVNVLLEGTTEGATTDMDGKFEFPIALEANDVLIFSYIGYDTKEYVVPEGETDEIEITISFKNSDMMLMGEVVVDGVYESKRNIFHKFIALFK